MSVFNILLIALFIACVYHWLYYHSPIIVTFQKLSPDAKAPTRGYHTACCHDVYSIEDVSIPAGQWREVRTGIKYAPWPYFYIPFLHLTLTPFGNIAFKIHTRSGMGVKKALRNHLGVIDSDYRGEITISIYNHGVYGYRIHPGDKIAQLEFHRTTSVKFIERERLSASLRGENRYGSTGK